MPLNLWSQRPGWLHSPPVVCGLFLVVVAFPVLLWTSYTLNAHEEKKRINASAYNITHDINEKIAKTRAFIASLVGLHYSSDGLEDNELMIFSQELRAENTLISGVGRYEKIRQAERESFEERMSEKGLFDFEITNIIDADTVKSRNIQQYYYPTSLLEPMEPGNLRLLGADLGAVNGLIDMLDIITAKNETLLAIFPDHWPNGGDLVLFRPVYLGKQAPTTPDARIQQADGGFWISINLAALLGYVNSNIRNFDVTVDIATDGDSRRLYAELGTQKEPRYLTSLFQRVTATEEWISDTSSVVVTLKHDLGFTKMRLAYTATAMIALFLVSALYTAHVMARKASLRSKLASKDALLRERKKAEDTLNCVQDAIITLDADMCIVHFNPAAAIQFNAKLSSTIGRPLASIVQFQIIGEEFAIFSVEMALANMASCGKREFDVTPVGQDPNEFVLRLTLSTSYDVVQNATSHVLVLRDISHEKRLTRRLAYQANHDFLTGCCNRFYFEQLLAGLIDELPFSGSTHSLCYMDLDQFKVVNDTCGHRAGDKLLTELTQNLLSMINENDVLSRLGGDEFGLLIVNASRAQAMNISERIYEFFQHYVFHHDDQAFAVRASIGIVHIDEHCNNLMDVMAAADIACYAAKDAGRNTMYVYSKTDDAMAERSVELSWLPRLQNALQLDEFRLHVQAVATVSSMPEPVAINHFEFLLRLANEDGSECTPWQFIQAAERYNLMRDIDKWVIRNALRTMAELKTGPAANCSFSINLSGQSAADPGFPNFIQEQMKLYQVNPSLLWFELTETAAISHFSVAAELIAFLRQMGCKVALDDFGSGLSSFSYLKNLPVDIIKIDGQFVRELARNPVDREMVRAINQVGRSMGVKTVAEFVESQEIMDVLVELGIDYAQGYHIGKPCSLDDAVGLLPPTANKAA